jgi:hypothetical protein
MRQVFKTVGVELLPELASGTGGHPQSQQPIVFEKALALVITDDTAQGGDSQCGFAGLRAGSPMGSRRLPRYLRIGLLFEP